MMFPQHYFKFVFDKDYIMGKRNGFNRKGELDASAAPATKKKFTAPTSRLEDIYFTWCTVSDAARCTKLIDKLKEYVTVHFQDQATVVARAMEELKAPVFTETERPVRIFWA